MSKPRVYRKVIAVSYEYEPNHKTYSVFSLHEGKLDKAFDLIEYSAYEELQARCERYRKAIQDYIEHESYENFDKLQALVSGDE